MSEANVIFKDLTDKLRCVSSNLGETKSDIILIAIIMAFAFSVRYYNLMGAGITWDEPYYVQAGITYLSNWMHADFQASSWSLNMEHPPVSKYLYGIVIWAFNGGVYDYNAFFVSKALSAAMGAMTCALVYVICREFFNHYVAVLSAAILALMPDFVAHTQIAAIDAPLTLLFTLTMYLFMIAVKRDDVRYYLASAVSLGLLLGTKFNGLLALPVMLILYLLARWKKGLAQAKPGKTCLLFRIDSYIPLLPALIFLAVAAATFYVIWPWIWTDPVNLLRSLKHWVYTPQEYFLGTLQPAPLYYYPLYFLATTPALMLLPLALGIYHSLRSRDIFIYAVLAWFLVPFSYNLYSFIVGGMRYLLMIYPAVAILCGYGVWKVVCRLAGPKETLKAVSLALAGVLVVVYLVYALASVSPYYLDYYNGLVGCTANVADHRLFNIGWWGEGMNDAIGYLEQNAPQNSTVLVAARPSHMIDAYGTNNTYICPQVDYFNVSGSEDYFVTNFYTSEYGGVQFNASAYRVAHQTMFHGVPLATVYEKAA